jgi:penicillin amidase
MGRYLGFHTGKIPMPGCHATPFQGHLLTTSRRETTFAPSFHFVTDLGTDEAWTNLPGGPSESRFSPLYKSDIVRWQTGTYKRVAM